MSEGSPARKLRIPFRETPLVAQEIAAYESFLAQSPCGHMTMLASRLLATVRYYRAMLEFRGCDPDADLPARDHYCGDACLAGLRERATAAAGERGNP